MIGSFNYIVNRHSFFILKTNGTSFKDITSLFFCKPATFYPIGVISQADLCFMI